MARFSKFKFIFALKLKFYGRVNLIKKYQILVISKSWQNLNTVGNKDGVAEDIGCENW